ncbi:uncharacterized protein E0L32_008611 [Thyridium curvatum]|uniref:Major facilitator superfamily (MFS) profile domain-containing protein n=1 Tax=Thyridium curvatum TaxID=1093900 RepID=A0A507AL36_9PEZI|nr:uncharacterized protein E0L32_008611 [Thyridium curvatum]TPX10392.1 hypothetical protein E0L32_008611 [Thyridium curvatum]
MATESSVENKGSPQHIEEGRDDQAHAPIKLAANANLASEDEHHTTFLQAVKRYPKAVAWSAAVSLCIIMDGFDVALMGSLFGFPAFQRKYGHQVGNTGKYTLDAQWQAALGMGTPIGNIIGITLNGILTDRFGHKLVMQAGLLLLTGTIFIQFFAPNVQVLFVGQVLCGIPWGIFSTLAPAFASEVAPLVLRSYLETWVVSCWGIGQFLSYAVLFSLNTRLDEWAYRIPFGIQWAWPVIILPIVSFCPDSPWWLVRKGRYDQAKKSVRRLVSAKNEDIKQEQAEMAVALMIETNQLEREISTGTTYFSCFRGNDLRRTEIAAVSWGSQILTGFTIQNYASYFFQQAGISANDAFKMVLGTGAIHLVCNLASAALTGNVGRRPLYLGGCVVLSLLMFTIGGLAFGPLNTTFGNITSAIYLIWFGVWCLTLGPLPYVINGEVSSTRLRAKTLTIARATYVVLNIVNSVSAPYILNPQKANWRGKTGLLTGGLTVLTLIWAYFRLPETGGRTYEELDILFAERNLSARKFSKAVIHRNNGTFRVTGPHDQGTG